MTLRQTIKKSVEGEKNSMYGLFVVAGVSAALALVLFLIASTVNEVKEYKYIGKSPVYENGFPVVGKGEVFAVPDIGSFSFSIIEDGPNVGEAQRKATEKNNEIIKYLKDQGVEARDIKTSGYNISPKYEYVQSTGRQNLVGYEINQTITVKIRNTEMSGELLEGVGSRGVSNVSGLTFTVDDEDSLKREARALAIQDAKEQAVKLSADLGIRLGRITGYYEMENPIYYPAYGMGGDVSKSSMMTEQALPPNIETGEQKITSQVTITYEMQ